MKPFSTFPRACATLAAIALAMTALGYYSVEILGHYGYAVFQGLPAAGAFTSVMLLGRGGVGSLWRNAGLGLLPLVGSAVIFAAAGMEGVICMVIATPVLLLFAAIGILAATGLMYLVTRLLDLIAHLGSGRGRDEPPRVLCAGAALVLLTTAIAMEPRLVTEVPLRSVQSSVVVNGDIESVWAAVIAFPEITAPPGGIFEYGIAYPIRATIEGTGVGAIRRCTFNTGDFVEPITVWDAPRHLAFDVVENPLPMREWGLWGDVDTPHLHGFMISERGEFRLTERAHGTVLLQGNTWYRHDLWPNAYWGWVSDQIIHAIHGRVLGHIKETVERQAGKG